MVGDTVRSETPFTNNWRFGASFEGPVAGVGLPLAPRPTRKGVEKRPSGIARPLPPGPFSPRNFGPREVAFCHPLPMRPQVDPLRP